MTEKDLKKLFDQKLEGMEHEFQASNWAAFEQMQDPTEPLSDQEFKKLFRDKLPQATFAFNPANWDALEAELGPENSISTDELKDLFQQKLAQTEYGFSPENWDRMEAVLNQRTRKPMAYFWRSAAVILLLGGLSAIFGLKANQSLGGDPYSNAGLVIQKSTIDQSPQKSIPSEAPLTGGSVKSPIDHTTSTAADAEYRATSPLSAVPPTISEYPKDPSDNGVSPLLALSSSPISKETIKEPRISALEVGRSGWKHIVLQNPYLTLQSYSSFETAPRESSSVKEPYIPQTYSKFFLVGGPAISKSMNGTMGAPGFQAGLEYQYGFNKVSSLTTGLLFNQTGDIGLETIDDSTFFGLGRTDVETHRHYKSISSIRVPLSYQYQLNEKHSFGLGFNMDMLISVSMNETKTTQAFKQDAQEETQNFRERLKSFEQINYSTSVNYQYQYSEKLSFALSYNLALNDITRDHAHNFEADHRPGQANLQLRYRLF
jgi:hypothetical protein